MNKELQEKIISVLVNQIALWALANPLIVYAERSSGLVPFMDYHKPIEELNALLEELNTYECQS